RAHGKKVDNHARGLHFLMADNHFHPIENESWRRKVAEICKDVPDVVQSSIIATQKKVPKNKGNKPPPPPKPTQINVKLPQLLNPEYHGSIHLQENQTIRNIL